MQHPAVLITTIICVCLLCMGLLSVVGWLLSQDGRCGDSVPASCECEG